MLWINEPNIPLRYSFSTAVVILVIRLHHFESSGVMRKQLGLDVTVPPEAGLLLSRNALSANQYSSQSVVVGIRAMVNLPTLDRTLVGWVGRHGTAEGKRKGD